MKVAIVGSRKVGNFKLEQMLARIPPEATELISGGAVGVDAMAERAARARNLPIRVFKPDYQTYGRGAPLVRDRQIVDAADLVLAFWDNRSRGTAYTLRYCIKTDKPFCIFPLGEPE